MKGEPFLEDLLSRFPSARLKIEVKGSAVATSEVTLEHLFGQLRTFGRINDLVLGPYVKEQPRQASVQFRKMYGAVGARNCIHRFAIPVVTSPPSPGPPSLAVLFFTYDSVLKTSYLIDFFNKHPRIMVPLIGLLFAAFTFLIFDPLRSFNIVNKVTGRFTIEGISSLGPLAWLRTQWTSLSKHRIFDVFKHGGEGTSGAQLVERARGRRGEGRQVAHRPSPTAFCSSPAPRVQASRRWSSNARSTARTS